MVNTYKHFRRYILYPSNKKIFIADGFLNIIIDESNIKFSPILAIKNMLYVFKPCTNLVSVNKLSQNLNYKVTFLLSHYDIQD